MPQMLPQLRLIQPCFSFSSNSNKIFGPKSHFGGYRWFKLNLTDRLPLNALHNSLLTLKNPSRTSIHTALEQTWLREKLKLQKLDS